MIGINLCSMLNSSHSIGIGIDEQKDMYAVGKINSDGKKNGYWHYLKRKDNKYLTIF